MKTFIVVPAYHEEKSIGKVIKELKSAGYKNIVVVDDGSLDRTSEVAKKQKATVICHPVNRGQGAALRTGIDYALAKGAETIVTFDADGQHDANDIKKMINPVAKGKVDIALGSRFLRKTSNVSFAKEIMLKGGALLFRIMYGIFKSSSRLTKAYQ